MKSKMVFLDLQHGNFKISGPLELITLIENAKRSLPPVLAKSIVEKELSEWNVVCAVTGDMIPLASLKYWSVDRQECYKNAEASLEAHRKTNP